MTIRHLQKYGRWTIFTESAHEDLVRSLTNFIGNIQRKLFRIILCHKRQHYTGVDIENIKNIIATYRYGTRSKARHILRLDIKLSTYKIIWGYYVHLVAVGANSASIPI